MCLACQNHLLFLFLFQATSLHFGAKNNGLLLSLQSNSVFQKTQDCQTFLSLVKGKLVPILQTIFKSWIKPKNVFLVPLRQICFGIGVLRCYKDRKSYLINVFQKHSVYKCFSKCNYYTVNPLLSPPRGGGLLYFTQIWSGGGGGALNRDGGLFERRSYLI